MLKTCKKSIGRVEVILSFLLALSACLRPTDIRFACLPGTREDCFVIENLFDGFTDESFPNSQIIIAKLFQNHRKNV